MGGREGQDENRDPQGHHHLIEGEAILKPVHGLLQVELLIRRVPGTFLGFGWLKL